MAGFTQRPNHTDADDRVDRASEFAAGYEVKLTLAATAPNVGVVRHVLAGLGDALDLDPAITDDVRLAVTEACANAVIHGYSGRGEGTMEVEAAVRPPHLKLLVRDHGRGLVPRLGSQGLGMGLPLIASLSDTLDVRTTEGATEVRMAFRLARPVDTAVLDAV